jgi:hypothetical protein
MQDPIQAVDGADLVDTDETALRPEIPRIPALIGDDPAARDAEIARFLAAPETVPPYNFFQYALALESADRRAEAAAWHMRGLLRLEVDIAFLQRATGATSLRRLLQSVTESGRALRPADSGDGNETLPVDSGDENETLRTLIEDAVAWELATPRRYDIYGSLSLFPESDAADSRARTPNVDLSPDERAVLADVQARVAAGSRAVADRLKAATDLETEAYAAAAARRPAREAIEAVPAEARARLTPLRSVRLACTGSPGFVDGSPVSADARHAALTCSGDEGAEYQIVDLVSGATVQSASQEPFHSSGAFAFADGRDVALAAYRSEAHSPVGTPDSGQAPLWAMRADRALAPLELPLPDDVRGKRLYQRESGVTSLSGRYAYVKLEAPRGALIEAVYDVAAQRLVWSETTTARKRDEFHRDAAFIDETQGAPALISGVFAGFFAYDGGAVERLNLQSASSIRRDWPNKAREQRLERYDEGRLLLVRHEWLKESAPDAPNATLVDLMTLGTVWRGRREDLPAETYSRPFCGWSHDARAARATLGRGRSYLATLTGVGEPIVLSSVRMPLLLADCAVSSDGRTLALMIGPIVHIYRIEPN